MYRKKLKQAGIIYAESGDKYQNLPNFAPMQAFEEIYRAYAKMVFNLALHYTQNRQDAEEITQNVFVKVYEKLADFREDAQLKTWIYRIAIRQAFDFLRAKKAQKRFGRWVSLFQPETERTIEIPVFDHPGVELEQQEALAQIFACIDGLPDKQRTAIILLKIEQKSQAETADIMGITTKAVESLFQRAKKKLGDCLGRNEGK